MTSRSSSRMDNFAICTSAPAMCRVSCASDQPDALDLRYTQKMMAFLLFNEKPEHIVMLGLGGGSLAKYCYRHLPNARISVVEINPEVIALRSYFNIPQDDSRFQVVCGDGARFIAEEKAPIDVLLIDAFDEQGIAPSMTHQSFLEGAYDHMAKDGSVEF